MRGSNNFLPPKHARERILSIKVNRVLNIILIAFVIIVLRLWHLAIIQHEERKSEAERPQRRTLIEAAKRGTIRDRFNIPIAVNRIQYNAAILYEPLRMIPALRWQKHSDGSKTKRFVRKEYIAKLSTMLAENLALSPQRVEDLIHAKAALYNQIPFVIKEDISEREYYSLKLLELKWPGVRAERVSRRYYPLGRVAGDIIGYIGAINREEYEMRIGQIAALQAVVAEYERNEHIALPAGFDNIAQLQSQLKELKAKTYSLNDTVGKAGIERQYERQLRGFNGKKSFVSDAKGRFLMELPGTQPPLSGQRLILSLSSELQEYAEKLLIRNEEIRETRATLLDSTHRRFLALKKPWIKGGAIIALDPNNGELLAMASHPRYDPNDYILSGDSELNAIKKSNMRRWLETDSHIAEIWNQQRPYQKEKYDPESDTAEDEGVVLNWKKYLEIILPANHPITILLNNFTLSDAVKLANSAQNLLEIAPEANGYEIIDAIYNDREHYSYPIKSSAQRIESIRRALEQMNAVNALQFDALFEDYFAPLPSNYDKVLLLDLCRLVVDERKVGAELLDAIGELSLGEYQNASAAMVQLNSFVEEICRSLFRDYHFTHWRNQNEKEFLKEERRREKEMGRYAKPYIDLLDRKEDALFGHFWSDHCADIILKFLLGMSAIDNDGEMTPYIEQFKLWHDEIARGAHRNAPWQGAYCYLQKLIQQLPPSQRHCFLGGLRGFQQLTRPLIGKYPCLRKDRRGQLEKDLAAAFYPKHGYGYGRSQSYRQAATQGSIFKLVTAYEALVQRYNAIGEREISLKKLNPLEIVDSIFYKDKQLYLGYNADGKPIPRYYKGGRLLRSVSRNLGKMDLLRAIETSSNPYFSLLAGEVLNSPADLARAAEKFSYGHTTGVDLPYELAGRVPNDLESNRTGLYATAIGQHSLVVTPLQSSVMLAALANGGKVLKPKVVKSAIGGDVEGEKGPLLRLERFPCQRQLAAVGIDFPLFLAAMPHALKREKRQSQPSIQREVEMPDKVRELLLEGMNRVTTRTHGENLSTLSRLYHSCPEAISDYIGLKSDLLGKTSTAEVNERIDLDERQGVNMYNHVWFGGIAFNREADDAQERQLFVVNDRFGRPELVLVIYLRYGSFGKEAAPLAAQLVAKWREIKARHSLLSLSE